MAYATVDEFKILGMPMDGWEEISESDIQLFLDVCQGVIDTYIGDRYVIPVPVENNFLKRCNVDLAACDILAKRGYNPEDGDEVYKERCETWLSTLEDIRRGNLSIPGIPNNDAVGSVQVSTKTRRGFLPNSKPDKVNGVS